MFNILANTLMSATRMDAVQEDRLPKLKAPEKHRTTPCCKFDSARAKIRLSSL